MPKQASLKPHEKAHIAGKTAETIFRAISSQVAKGWKFVSFRGPAGGESVGVVDVVAIRRNMSKPRIQGLKRGDLFIIMIIQIKGGSARKPPEEDIQRLRLVAKAYGASNIVLYEHRIRSKSKFHVLRKAGWEQASRLEIFG